MHSDEEHWFAKLITALTVGQVPDLPAISFGKLSLF